MYPTDLTVGAVIEADGRFLLVEELSKGRRVLTQPGGHIEAGESPEQATIRETLEEAGCDILCEDLIGVYLWIHPQSRRQFLRIVYGATLVHFDDDAKLDSGILARHWASLAEIEARRNALRTPVVLRCIHDFIAGRRSSDALLSGMLPLQQNVQRILATADLV